MLRRRRDQAGLYKRFSFGKARASRWGRIVPCFVLNGYNYTIKSQPILNETNCLARPPYCLTNLAVRMY
jgi:hypothetical protein